jgi:hypothetical protein
MVHIDGNLEELAKYVDENTCIYTTNQFLLYSYIKEINPTLPSKNIFWLRRESALEPGYVINGKDFWVGYVWAKSVPADSGANCISTVIIGDRRLFSNTYVDLHTRQFIKNEFHLVSSTAGISIYHNN